MSLGQNRVKELLLTDSRDRAALAGSVTLARVHKRIVIVGASLAGARAAHGLRAAGHDGPLTLIGAEPHLPYDRPPLSKEFLTGDRDAADLALDPPGAYDDLDIDLMLGTVAVGLDLTARTVRVAPAVGGQHSSDGGGGGGQRDSGGSETVPFDGLVIATGASARPLPGAAALAGVYTLRTLDDAAAIGGALVPRARVVVVGAGFIGSEVAAAAKARGCDVTVIEAAEAPLVRGLGAAIGARVGELHARNGVELRLGASVAGLVAHDSVADAVGDRRGRDHHQPDQHEQDHRHEQDQHDQDHGHHEQDHHEQDHGHHEQDHHGQGHRRPDGREQERGDGAGRVSAVVLADGSRIPADVVVVGIGAAPNTAWLQGSGLRIDGGVVCDATLCCGPPGVYAVGDVARAPNAWLAPWHGRAPTRVEHWTAAVEHAMTAARNLAAPDEAKPYDSVPYVWSDQYDARVQIAGDPGAADETEVLIGSADAPSFVAGYRRGDRLSGVMALNAVRPFVRFRRLLAGHPSWREAQALAADLSEPS